MGKSKIRARRQLLVQRSVGESRPHSHSYSWAGTRSRAALVCDVPTERNIRALMAFESFTTSYAHSLRGTFDRVSSNPTSQKLQPAAVWAPKRVESGETPTFVWRRRRKRPAKQKYQSGIAIQLVNPHTAKELRTRRNELIRTVMCPNRQRVARRRPD